MRKARTDEKEKIQKAREVGKRSDERRSSSKKGRKGMTAHTHIHIHVHIHIYRETYAHEPVPPMRARNRERTYT